MPPACGSLSRGSVERVAAAIRRYFLATGFEATALDPFSSLQIEPVELLLFKDISGIRYIERHINNTVENRRTITRKYIFRNVLKSDSI